MSYVPTTQRSSSTLWPIKLKPQLVKELFAAFKHFQLDSSELIMKKDFPNFLDLIGQVVTEAEVIKMLKEIEGDLITFNQILILMTRYYRTPFTTNEINQVFHILNQSEDGILKKEEIEFMINSLGVRCLERDINRMHLKADFDRDGEVTSEDLYKFVHKAVGDSNEI